MIAMKPRISWSDVIGVAAGVISLVLLYIIPSLPVLGLTSNILGVSTGIYSLFWLIFRIIVYYSGPHLRATPGLSGGSLSIFINNSSSTEVFLDSVHILHNPDNIRLTQFPNGTEVTDLDAMAFEGEQVDISRTPSVSTQVKETICNFKTGYLAPPVGQTKIGFDIIDSSYRNKPVIHLLWIKLHYRINPSGVPFIPFPALIDRLYGPFPVKIVEYRYEGEYPHLWARKNRTGPERIDPPYKKRWPDFPDST